MNTVRAAVTVLARFLLSAMFLERGMHKIFYWHESERLMRDMLSNWQSHLSFSEAAQNIFSSLVNYTHILVFSEGTLELVGGLLLLLGIKEKLGASLLIIALLPATILFHQFWFVDVAGKELQQQLFLKNLGIMGGLLMVLLYGAQSPSKKNAGFN